MTDQEFRELQERLHDGMNAIVDERLRHKPALKDGESLLEHLEHCTCESKEASR